jgi:hypothetical protein
MHGYHISTITRHSTKRGGTKCAHIYHQKNGEQREREKVLGGINGRKFVRYATSVMDDGYWSLPINIGNTKYPE